MQPVRRFQRRSIQKRSGLAVTELAVCMPVLVLIVLATVEACAMLFLQQSLSIAAYEGARVSLVPGAKSENAIYQCELILQGRGVQEFSATVTPTDIPNTPAGAWIKVDASAPFAENSLAGGWLFNERVLSASVEMMKEH